MTTKEELEKVIEHNKADLRRTNKEIEDLERHYSIMLSWKKQLEKRIEDYEFRLSRI